MTTTKPRSRSTTTTPCWSRAARWTRPTWRCRTATAVLVTQARGAGARERAGPRRAVRRGRGRGGPRRRRPRPRRRRRGGDRPPAGSRVRDRRAGPVVSAAEKDRVAKLEVGGEATRRRGGHAATSAVRRKVTAATGGAGAIGFVPILLQLAGALDVSPEVASTLAAVAAALGALVAGWATPERQAALPPRPPSEILTIESTPGPGGRAAPGSRARPAACYRLRGGCCPPTLRCVHPGARRAPLAAAPHLAPVPAAARGRDRRAVRPRGLELRRQRPQRRGDRRPAVRADDVGHDRRARLPAPHGRPAARVLDVRQPDVLDGAGGRRDARRRSCRVHHRLRHAHAGADRRRGAVPARARAEVAVRAHRAGRLRAVDRRRERAADRARAAGAGRRRPHRRRARHRDGRRRLPAARRVVAARALDRPPADR